MLLLCSAFIFEDLSAAHCSLINCVYNANV